MHLALHEVQGHTKYEREIPVPAVLTGREEAVID